MDFLEGLFGDEFPEAFNSSNGLTMKSTKSILDLPAELLAIVAEDLPKMDLKRLRLANRYLATNVDLRIDRVHISPNRANLECLQNILDHPRYRLNIHEIIWDDAQLDEYPDLDSFRDAILIDESNKRAEIEHLLVISSQTHESDGLETHLYEHDDFFDPQHRLTELAKGILLRRDDQASRDIIAGNVAFMSMEESFEAYQSLYQEERNIMKQMSDAAALHHALKICPNLDRIVLTSEVWRPWNFQPAYATAYAKHLPPGFRKPSVWPWLGHRSNATLTQVVHRDEVMKTAIAEQSSSLPHEFRGYSIVISALIAMPKPSNISELIIYPGNETIGIGHQLFATFNTDWINTISMARVIPLKRLKLAINSYGADHTTSASYLQSGQIHAALRTMPLLEHLDLSLNCLPRRGDRNSVEEWVFDYSDILPIPLVHRLKTFALRNVNMYFEKLLDLLQNMKSAQHITLDNIAMDSIEGFDATYFKLFRKMWIYYDMTQPEPTRPAFCVIEPVLGGTRSRMVFEELNQYMHVGEYHDEIPFEDRGEGHIRGDCGWVIDDRDERFVERGGASWLVGGTEGW